MSSQLTRDYLDRYAIERDIEACTARLAAARRDGNREKEKAALRRIARLRRRLEQWTCHK